MFTGQLYTGPSKPHEMISWPSNLPDLEELRSFSAKGTSGVVNTDINGRSAAIEWYLDLRFEGRS